MKKTLDVFNYDVIKKWYTLFIVALLFVSMIPAINDSIVPTNQGTAKAAIIYVDANPGGSNNSTIQDAINNASNADIIIINATGALFNGTLYVNKSVTLTNNTGVNPVIDAKGGHGIIINASDVKIENLTIQNATGGFSILVQTQSHPEAVLENIVLSNLTITDSDVGIWFGYHMGFGSNVTNSTISNCNISNASIGILISNSNNCTVSDSTVFNVTGDPGFGIFLQNSWDNNLSKNRIYNNTLGIELISSTNNNISSNHIYNNTDGVELSSSSTNNNITSNHVYNNTEDGISLSNSENNNISFNTIYNNTDGINFWQSNNSEIFDNSIFNNSNLGIDLSSSQYNNITSNHVYNNSGNYGINLGGSDNNNITSNHVYNNTNIGIRLYSSSNNNISYNNIYLQNNTQPMGGLSFTEASHNNDVYSNNIYDNYYALQFDNSNNTNIISNTIYDNYQFSIQFQDPSSGSLIYNNNFTNNNITYANGNNTWNTSKRSGTNIIGGPYLGGNYWSDYTGEDTDGDGIGDSNHSISGLAVDEYPLVTDSYPSQENPYPSSGSTNIHLTPNLNITVDDVFGDSLDAHWYSNSTGTWDEFGTNTSIDTSSGPVIINQTNSNFSGLSTTYYWSVNLTDGTYWTNETYHFTTRNPVPPSAPIEFTATTYNRTAINLSWINDGSNFTYIEWNTSSNWTRGAGIEIENSSTNTTFNHTGLDMGTIYYYQAWSYNVTDNCYSVENSSAWNTTNLNILPVLLNPSPNGTIVQNLSPICNVTVIDTDEDSLIVYFYENTTGSWALQQTNTSVTSGDNVVWNNYSNASLYNTMYWWSVNVTDGHDWTNVTYSFTTTSNSPPVISTVSPSNGATDQDFTPICTVTVTDANNDLMNVSFYEINTTGAWVHQETNESVSSGDIVEWDNYSNVTEYNTEYWWSVNVTDGHDWTNQTFYFTTTNTVYVNSTYTSATNGWETTRFKNLTRAISKVTDNVTIRVDPGTYKENLTIDKPLTLIANGSKKPVIDASELIGINISANFTTIRNLQITNCSKGIELNATAGTILHNITIERNNFYNCSAAIFSNASFDNNTMNVRYNKFLGDNITMGMNFTNALEEINATLNYWGSITGPTHDDNPVGRGINVSENVIFSPWIGINGGQITAGQINTTEVHSGPRSINASTDAGVANISINLKSTTNVTVAGYSTAPEGINGTVVTVGGILDLEIENESAVNWPINLTMYYTANDLSSAGLDEENLDGMYRWNETRGAWQIYNHTGVNTTEVTVEEIDYAGSCWANVYQGQLSPKAMANTNDAPNNPTGITPPDAETYVEAQPTINVTVTDNDANNMTVEFYENTTGSWILQQTSTSVTNDSNVIWNSYMNATDNMTTYYWSVNITDGKLWTNNTYSFTTGIIPSAPTDFTATKDGSSKIDLSWTKNCSADNTYIERASSASWTRGSGTEVYNGTSTSYGDSVSSATTYYYQAWSYNESNNSYSVTYASDSDTTSSASSSSPPPSGGTTTPPPTSSISITDITQNPEMVSSEDTVEITATITATDGVGVATLYYEVDEGVEQSKVMAGSDDSYSVTIGPFNPGVLVTYYISVVDENDVADSSNTFSFEVDDITGPTITLSTPTAGSTISDTRPFIIISFSDPSGIDTDSIEFLLDSVDLTDSATVSESELSFIPDTALSIGQHTISISVADALGNINENTWSFNIVEDETEIVETVDDVKQGETHDVDVTMLDSSIQEISFTAAVDLMNVKITCTVLESRPTGISTPENTVYQFLDISSNVDDADIESVTITFKVALDWFTTNDIDTEQVILIRYQNNNWQRLSTTMANEDSMFVYYEATTPGLSTFAITGEQIVKDTPEPDEGLPWLFIILGIIALIVAVFLILVKTGYIYFEHEEK
jgi:PGF-pre-PGF domain-containing protein